MKAKIVRWERVKSGDTVLRSGKMVKVAGIGLTAGELIVHFSGGEWHARVNPQELVAVRE